MQIIGETIDDLLRCGLQRLLEQGSHINPRKGAATELVGVNLRLGNPRARFSRMETRGILYSALGEILWYLSGSDEFSFIEHYIPKYRERCNTPSGVEHAEAAYGPRIQHQLPYLKELLHKPDTRRAVISIYRHEDQKNLYDFPCTCILQFLPRNGKLHAIAYMRSNDIFIGFPHDVFAFTFIQEWLACCSGLKLGEYIHMVGSFHLYADDRERAHKYLEEGVADTVPMDPMPNDDPEGSLEWLQQTESAARAQTSCPEGSKIAAYWHDLALIFQARRLRVARLANELERLRDAMHSSVFRAFLNDEIDKI